MKVYIKKGTVTPVEITDLVVSFNSSNSMQEDRLLGNTPSMMLDLDLNNTDGVLSDCAGNTFLIDLKEADSTEIPTQEFIVQEAPEKYTKKLSLNLYDVMIKFNKPYKSSLAYEKDKYPTISQQLDEMSNLAGVRIDKTGLSNTVLNKKAQWIDTTIIMRDYIGWIAELSGTNALINESNTLVFRNLFTADHDIEFTSDFEKTDLITISRVAYDDGVNLIASGNDTGKTIYIDANNSYCDSQTYTDAILAKYNGQSFYGMSDLKAFGKDTIKLGDTATYDGNKCIVLSIKRKYVGTQSVVELDGEVALKNVDSVVTKVSDKVRIKRLQVKVDQDANKLEIVAKNLEDAKGDVGNLQVETNKIKTQVENISAGTVSGTKQYYLQTVSADKPSKTDSAWTTTKPPSIAGQHMWYMLADVANNGTEIKHEPFELTGIKGDTGRGIVGSPTLTYQASNSSTTVPTGAWLNSIPLVNEGYTLWTKATWKYSDGTSSNVYSPSIAGKTGKGIKSVETEYYLSTSKTEVTGGEWKNTQPSKTADTWIWTRLKTTFTDNSVGYSEPIKDDVLNGLIETSISNKSTIEQLNGSITHLVNQTTENKTSVETVKTELKSLQEQTVDGFSRTVQRTEFDKTVTTISEKLDEHGLHIGSDKEDTVTTVDTNGVNVKKSDGTLLAKFDKVDSMLAYLRVLEYLSAGAHRVEAKETEAEITQFVNGTIKTARVKATVINWIGDINNGNAK
nr:MAG TPA: tail protein [Caudoviricetes sp.]